MAVPSLESAVPARPTTSAGPRRGLLVVLAVGAITAALANLVPDVLTLSLEATVIDPAHATGLLSLVVAVGSVCSLVAFPVLGRLSDRTTSRFGRRRPFLVAGAVLFVVGGVVTAAAGDRVTLVLGFVATAIGYSSAFVACTAAIPDQFSAEHRGPASAIVGLALPIGAVVGLFIAQLFSPDLALMVLAPAVVGALGALVLAVALPDRRLPVDERPPFDGRALLGTFSLSPRRAPDFAWAWWSRLLVFAGVAAVQAYQAFFLIAVLHFTPATVAGAIFTTTLVLTLAALVLAPVAAKLADRIGRRKPFVVGAAVVFAVGLVLAATADSFGAFVVAMIVIGAGQGVYAAVDIALITLVLPDPANPAKDLGMMNLANTLPHSLTPVIAPAILLIGATVAAPQNFAALFGFGAVASLLGAVMVLRIRGVR